MPDSEEVLTALFRAGMWNVGIGDRRLTVVLSSVGNMCEVT